MKIAFLTALLFLVAPTEPRTISWTDLVPEGAATAVAPGDPADHEGGAAQQTGSAEAVAELDGAFIRMPGFMLPLDYTEKGKVKAFLLVPYYGACIHVPPPPPNQIVLARYPQGLKLTDIYTPLWVSGTLKIEQVSNDLADAAYAIDKARVKVVEEADL